LAYNEVSIDMKRRLLDYSRQGTECAVRVDGGLTDWFETMVGVLQGCILSPLLFNILLEVVVALALHGCGVGTSISGINIPELRFADDISLLAECEHDLQDLVDHLHAASSRFGLKVSNSKTEVQCIGKDERKMNIKLANTELKQSCNFVYLGGVISADSSCDKDVAKIGIAFGVVRNLDDIWKSKEITAGTKVELYQSPV